MISINAPLANVSSLSVRASLILSWIPGAMQWVESAIKEPSLTYNFTSETALLDSIISGLYSTKLVPVAQTGVVAASEFLMTLSEQELQTLALSLPQKNTQAFEQLGESKGAITSWHILQAQSVLETLQISGNGLFLMMTLEDIASLSQLNAHIKQADYPDFVYLEAAKFGLKAACNAGAFSKLVEFACRALNEIVTKHQAKKITPAITNKFNNLYQDLLAKAVSNLSCPQLLPNQSTRDIAVVLQYWSQQQRCVGFRDMPTALVTWIRYFPVQSLIDDIGSNALIQEFQRSLITFTHFISVSHVHLSQDAQYWYAQVSNPNQSDRICKVMLDESGCISVTEFIPVTVTANSTPTSTLPPPSQ